METNGGIFSRHGTFPLPWHLPRFTSIFPSVPTSESGQFHHYTRYTIPFGFHHHWKIAGNSLESVIILLRSIQCALPFLCTSMESTKGSILKLLFCNMHWEHVLVGKMGSTVYSYSYLGEYIFRNEFHLLRSLEMNKLMRCNGHCRKLVYVHVCTNAQHLNDGLDN